MRFLDTAVDHFDEDVGVLVELNHELLLFLHVPEVVFLDGVAVVEKQIVLRCQLNPYILNIVVVITLYSHAQYINYQQRKIRFLLTITRILTLIASSVPTS